MRSGSGVHFWWHQRPRRRRKFAIMTRTAFEKPPHPAANDGSRRDFRAEQRIAAPAHRAWQQLSDVVAWPSWLPTVSAVIPLDGPRLQIGNRYKVAQPKLRPATWRVTHVNVGRSFEWESKTVGLCMRARHSINRTGDDAFVELEFWFSGFLAPLAMALYGKLTRDYLKKEALALKVAVEKQRSVTDFTESS